MDTPEVPVFWIENILRFANISVSGLLVFIGKKLADKFQKNTEAIDQHTTELKIIATVLEFLKQDVEDAKVEIRDLRNQN